MHKAIGNKAVVLKRLKSAGFNVPLFFSINQNTSFDEVCDKVKAIFEPDTLLAIRSSSELEDGNKKSYAGAFHTEIAIRVDELEEGWTNVKNALPSGGENGIIIQEFISGEYSGVVFVDPDLGRISVNALPGLCKAVVEGWDCEHYDFRDGSLINKRIKNTYNCLQLINGKLSTKQIQSSFNKDRLKSVIEISHKISQYLKKPQDIEWTIKNGEIYILQSRPISRSLWLNKENNMLFDSANIGESYSGIVLPLTSSFAKHLYKDVYINSLIKSGVTKKKIDQNMNIFDELIACMYGRLYYRMDNWYRMMAMIPGYSRNSKNLKNMLTLNFDEDINIHQYKPSLLLRLTYFPRILIKFIFFDKTMKNFRKEVELAIDEAANWNFNKMSINDAQNKIGVLMNGVAQKWYLTIENDTVMMTLYGKLTKSINNNHLEKLLEFPSVSTKQINMLIHLSKSLCQSNKIKSALKNKDVKLFENELEVQADKKRLDEEYLKKFGGRFANELKLETSDINEDFNNFSNLILTYNSLKTEYQATPMSSDTYVEKLFKKFASRREDFRLMRANMFAIIRKLALRIGECFEQKGLLLNRDDVFFLDFNDINGEIDVSAIDFKKIDERKREYSFFQTFHPPSHFKVENGLWPTFSNRESDLTNTGLGASKGQVVGKAVVLEEFSIPKKDSFEILVTRRTDPGWTALMALSKGIVVEHGGILSHASIVARELGIPAVIGIEKVCEKFTTGDMLFVDGNNGIVQKVN